jgi:hypothetical protein
MNISEKESKRLASVLGILQLFIGLSAVGGGLGLVLEPNGSNLGMPLEMLKYSPFSDFLIPGIVLLILLVVFQVSDSFTTLLRSL